MRGLLRRDVPEQIRAAELERGRARGAQDPEGNQVGGVIEQLRDSRFTTADLEGSALGAERLGPAIRGLKLANYLPSYDDSLCAPDRPRLLIVSVGQ